MKNKFQLLFILLTIIIVLFPSVCFSEMKTVQGENCKIYMGDMRNKKELDEFRKDVRRDSIVSSILSLTDPSKNKIKVACIRYILYNYLEKVETYVKRLK
jgi:hypothetical protein